ncbi:DUF6266 family protein [Parabacteroides sp. FAFU027]|uniref:DUF6266 family protein n=1 Tax=Parabacteroides sp. FAFU027 TaxID=2922715 RepID=UPI001FAFC3E2|nr:DUF6266 family protein [Parabacteroides sp. FAFU027]
MAKFFSTTFGEISGRHGNAVAAVTKEGKCILKVFRAPSNPNTDKQLAQRSKFGMVNSELCKLQNLFSITFGYKEGKSRAVSLALANAITGDYPDYAIDISKLTFSEGNVTPTGSTTAEKVEGSKVKITWDTTTSLQEDVMDGVNLIFMNSDSKLTILKQNVTLRPNGSFEVELPAVWIGAEIHCWIYFSNPAGNTTSNSQYISLLQL